MIAAHIICAVFLSAALVTDIRYMKIPNMLTLPAVLAGLVFFGVSGGLEGLLFSLKGMAAGFGIVLIMYIAGAVGAGDVKLFGGIGAWCGAWFTIQALFYSVLCAGMIGMLILLWRKETLKRLRTAALHTFGMFMFKSMASWKHNKKEHLRFPFMLAVVPGMIWTYFYQM
ncbi:prepilin peptidase [Paenibacillus lemnae]|uniref:Prepilin peptidase n=1 Tax=Paenibacillus lemnae TaxID=1330551 RepID=A0A848M6C5_PAELE|nr:prepilin peptidase [Paenibacillus lemnae]